MCPMEEIVSCQLSFVPIDSKDYLADIELVLDLIIASGLQYNIGDMSTLVKGSKTEVFSLISSIYDLMSSKCSFVLDVKLSNLCGCKNNLKE